MSPFARPNKGLTLTPSNPALTAPSSSQLSYARRACVRSSGSARAWNCSICRAAASPWRKDVLLLGHFILQLLQPVRATAVLVAHELAGVQQARGQNQGPDDHRKDFLTWIHRSYRLVPAVAAGVGFSVGGCSLEASAGPVCGSINTVSLNRQ